jgi:hypothetical protein
MKRALLGLLFLLVSAVALAGNHHPVPMALDGKAIITFADDESPRGQGAGNTVLTLAHAPSPASSLRVFRNSVRQRVTTDYALSGTTLTLVLALSSTDVIVVDYRY